jgi:hypothetical protein
LISTSNGFDRILFQTLSCSWKASSGSQIEQQQCGKTSDASDQGLKGEGEAIYSERGSTQRMLPKSVSFFGRFLTAGPRELSPLSLSLSVVVVFFPLNTTASLLSFSRFALLCFFFFKGEPQPFSLFSAAMVRSSPGL